MAPPLNSMEKRKFGSFAVLDFETSNLPDRRYFKVGLTELSIYGIAISEFNNSKENVMGKLLPPPALPRVLHKLTLMINPMMRIDPESERITGLDNYMLEAESNFDENAGNLLLSFLSHLQQPVCLVAHNGYTFDFPILKYVLERKGMTMPDSIYALDSLRAFHDIDKTLEKTNALSVKFENKDQINVEVNSAVADTETELKGEEEKFDARSQNETTPKRPIKRVADAATLKRTRADAADDDIDREHNTPKVFRSRRKLNFGETPTSSTNKLRRESGRKWFPPKNIYKLPNMFLRVFCGDPIVAHHAEADVEMLTKLMLHYGQHFVDYAEDHAVPFSEIPQLGRPNNI